MDRITRTLPGRVLLCLVLLAGWQSALVHPLTHVDKNGGYVHLNDGQPKPKKSDSSGLCDVLAALAACVAGTAQAFIAGSAAQDSPQRLPAGLLTAEAPPFLSQGPPTVL